MNLVVAARREGSLMRLEVQGRWESGDALKLAYYIKAALARVRQDHVLVDLTRLQAGSNSGKFQICDRLHRALTHKARIGLVGAVDLLDETPRRRSAAPCPAVAVFPAESEAIDWLGARAP